MSRLRPKTLMLITAALIFVGFTGGVTWLLYQQYFKDGGQSTESRSRASTAMGEVELKLVTESNDRYVKDTFVVKVMLDSKGKKISGIAFGLSYPSGSAAVPGLEVVDTDGNTANGIQIKSNLETFIYPDSNPPGSCFGVVTNLVSRPPGTGNRDAFIDFAAGCSSFAGYQTDGPIEIARITFRANAAGTYAITADPRKAVVTQHSDATDILKTVDQTTINVLADAVKPTLVFTEGVAEGATTPNGAVTFKVEATELPARPADLVKPDNYIEYRYRFDAEAFSNWSPNNTFTKVVQHGARKITVEARDLNGNVSAALVRSFTASLSPIISSVVPNAAVANTEITLTGTNFGTTKGSVHFGTVAVAAANITEWTDTRIKVKVPPTAGSGVKVTPVGSGAPASAVVAFTLESKLDLTYLLQNVISGATDRTVDVILTSGTKKIIKTGQVAKWSTTHNAYQVVTTDLGPDFVAGNWIVSIKDGNHLRKKYPAVAMTKGTVNVMVKKTAPADLVKAGDVDGNNKINISDFAKMVTQFKSIDNALTDDNRIFDLNNSGRYTTDDISLLLVNYTALEVAGDTE